MWTRPFGKSDSVVRVAMSQDDIGYVTRVISEALDLPYRGLSLIEVESGHFDEFTSDPLHRPLDILQANSGVNQHEAALILHQQTMAGNRSFSRTRPAAIDMAHAHHNATLTSQFAEPESRYNPRMPKLLRIAPELPVADVPGSIEYYRRALGFSSASIMPDEEYAIVERDGISVHLFRSEGPKSRRLDSHLHGWPHRTSRRTDWPRREHHAADRSQAVGSTRLPGA